MDFSLRSLVNADDEHDDLGIRMHVNAFHLTENNWLRQFQQNRAEGVVKLHRSRLLTLSERYSNKE